MKKLFPLFLMIVLIPSLWAMERDQMTLDLTPGITFFNSLNASSFDPDQPNNQPLIFTVQIHNTGLIEYSMHVELLWNSNQLFDTYFLAKTENIQSMTPLTNQSLLTANASMYFHSPDPGLDLNSIMNENPEFKDAILNTGRLPDGIYYIHLQTVSPDNHSQVYSNELVISFEVRNANAIYLQSPGVPLGSMIPSLGVLPLTFIWNSNLVGLNIAQMPSLGKFTLTIREFNQVEELQADNVENGQIFRLIPDIMGSIYTEYIPFQNNKYYAWQISTPLSASNSNNPDDVPALKSPWYVFKFTSEVTGDGSGGDNGTGLTGSNGASGGTTAEDELLIFLTNLNDPQVNGLLNDEFRPTGNVFVGDQLYTGNSALQQLQRLAGKTIKSITVSDE
jgi:hypothetical protein